MIKTKKEACKAQPSENEKKNQGFLEDCIKEIPQLNDCLICIFFFFETNVLVFMPLKKF